MFDKVRQLLSALETSRDRQTDVTDPRVAAAALLVHVAEADGVFTGRERSRLRALLQHKFSIGPRDAERLLESGRRADAEAVDLYRFTSVLMSRMDEAQRLAFIELIWAMIYEEDGVHELEDNLAWRIAELLGISTQQRMAAKRAVARGRETEV